MNGNKPVLPKGTKSKGRKTLLFVGIGAGAAAAIAIVVLLVLHSNTPQYAISVNPQSEMVMGSGMNMRVYVTNTGSQPLTNIKLDWGDGKSDSLPILDPGEREMFSPPPSATMVTVTADNGIRVMKSLMSQ
jgi:hypothetical protein